MLTGLAMGFILGLGAAVPLGPVNLEIMRRHLFYSTVAGISLGAGACLADFTYLMLLSLSLLSLLDHGVILHSIGIAGSLVLLWFAWQAFHTPQLSVASETHKRAHRHMVDGYIMTMLNPFTILFWLSISAQFTSLSWQGEYAVIFAGIGVLLGTFSWVLFLNTVLYVTRQKTSITRLSWLNLVGGSILLLFACYGLWHNAQNLIK